MSNPTPPTPPQPEDPSPGAGDAQPTEVFAPADVQPTEVYAPADVQPTEVYAPADVQPTEVYPPAVQPGYGQPASQPAYGAPAYGAPVADGPAYEAPAASAADRPRTLGWISLGVSLGGLALVGAAFIPLVWVSLILALIGGLLLLVSLVLGIVTLASKKQGGKGLGIGAIAVSVLGGLAWIGAITLAFVLITFAGSNSAEPGPAPSSTSEVVPDDEATEEETEEPTGTYDEAAYLAQVRPEITAIMQEIEPGITEEMLGQIYSDETLVSIGQTILAGGELGKDLFVSSIAGEAGLFTEDQATRFYDSIYSGAQQYLVE